jgi:hypothetical protein
MKNILVYFVGTAGSGKTALTGAFYDWVIHNGHDAIIVNLDPGVEVLPYEPDIDIREWLVLAEVMRQYELGPNGAQIACADMLALKIPEVKERIDKIDTDYVLIDTPGQMELFTFRKSSTQIIEKLGRDKSFMILLFDPFIALTSTGFTSQILLSATTQFRFYLPMLSVLSKSDMITPEELEQILNWSTNPHALMSAIFDEEVSMHTKMSSELLKALEELGIYKAVVPTSAETQLGMEDIYNAIQQHFAGGEDLEGR